MIIWRIRYVAALLLGLLALAPPGFAGQKGMPHSLQVLTEELAPLNYTRQGEVRGVCAEVVREIIRRTRTHTPSGIRVLPWSRAYAKALATPNVALFSTVRSPEREDLFHWVGPIYTSHVVMFKRRGHPVHIASLEDARSLTVGVLQDYFEQQYLQQRGFTNLYIVPGAPEQMVHLLSKDRIDLWFQSWPTGTFAAARAGKAPDWLEVVLEVTDEQLYIAFSRDTDSKIIDEWTASLEAMKSDGSYDAIISRFESGLMAR
ncbi:substrate-binding periplasmic protein [Desulfovibrio psychrotolerans]|uniref:ABC transporter substrate-binding protein n=1 Tax=Desulfovibrio psychrotolerans TaxID=415242 RepID=A0A7J0BXN7_9BACT|nr:transporter substrate-binding domain-containing protein [Desulfovibrio psychrotolerans]GFM37941.1 ABC transporter substrate-binding protein [Desulfovibrio psychrotolerans]